MPRPVSRESLRTDLLTPKKFNSNFMLKKTSSENYSKEKNCRMPPFIYWEMLSIISKILLIKRRARVRVRARVRAKVRAKTRAKVRIRKS